MGALNATTVEQINRAIYDSRTFAVVLCPDASLPLWFEGSVCKCASPHGAILPDFLSFDIAPWLKRFADRWSLGSNLPTWQPMNPVREGMSRGEYLNSVKRIIDSCKVRHGKTVFSRTICGDVPKVDNSGFNWGETADIFFSHFPQTFRYICYSPATKGWMGASPELLLDFNKNNGQFHTVAFAGTRKSDLHPKGWDKKNLRENKFVSDYIISALNDIGARTTLSPLRTVAYGDIEHLCSDIYGCGERSRLGEILDAINPTPALCGFPKEAALADLETYEPHQRHCYGGFIGIETSLTYRAYVNLRCVHFDFERYCIYGGGGIIGESVPESEYEETVAKTSFLLKLFK